MLPMTVSFQRSEFLTLGVVKGKLSISCCLNPPPGTRCSSLSLQALLVLGGGKAKTN